MASRRQPSPSRGSPRRSLLRDILVCTNPLLFDRSPYFLFFSGEESPWLTGAFYFSSFGAAIPSPPFGCAPAPPPRRPCTSAPSPTASRALHSKHRRRSFRARPWRPCAGRRDPAGGLSALLRGRSPPLAGQAVVPGPVRVSSGSPKSGHVRMEERTQGRRRLIYKFATGH